MANTGKAAAGIGLAALVLFLLASNSNTPNITSPDFTDIPEDHGIDCYGNIIDLKKWSYFDLPTNLAVMPDDFHTDNFDSDGNSLWTYLVWDTSVTFGGNPTLRMDKLNGERSSRECYFKFRSVQPGDHVVYSVWVKTDTFATETYRSGGGPVVDLWGRFDGTMRNCMTIPQWIVWADGVAINGYWQGPNGDVANCEYSVFPVGGVYPSIAGHLPIHSNHKIQWNTSTWTQITYDFVVPNTYFYVIGDSAVKSQIQYIAPNLETREFEDDASAWFGGCELYINPESQPPDPPPNPTPTSWIGVSSLARQQGTYSPYALSSIDEVIGVMDSQNLNIWRMCLEPDFDNWEQFIQYYLDNCDYDLIVEPNHYYEQTLMTNAQWTTATNRCLDILAAFSGYQDRLWIEPQNEQLTDITAKTQAFVTAVRNAGYTNNIVSNVFWRPTDVDTAFQQMATISDPLDRFWTGQHWYINQISLASIKNYLQLGLSYGLKLINTEVGADANEIAYFSQSEVDDLSSLLEWCAERGIGNTVWLMYGDYNWPTYEAMELKFPYVLTPEPPPEPPDPPPPASYFLTVTSTSGGSAYITSGYNPVPLGSIITVFAAADTNYSFKGWKLNSYYPYSTSNPVNVSMTSDNTIQAVFEATPQTGEYKLTVLQSTGGTTTPTGTHVYADGTLVSLLATAFENYTFSKWQVDGVTSSETSTRLNVTVNADKVVRAFFTADSEEPVVPASTSSGGGTYGVEVSDLWGRVLKNLRDAPSPPYSTALKTFKDAQVPSWSNAIKALKETKI